MLVLCVIQKKHWWILSSHKKASIVGYERPSCGLGKGTILEKRIRVNLLQLLCLDTYCLLQSLTSG